MRVVVDQDGTVWMTRSRAWPELLSFNGQVWTAHDLPSQNDVLNLQLDELGRLWASYTFQDFVRNDTGWKTYEHTRWASAAGNVAVDAQGRTWIRGGNEIGVLDGQRWTFIPYEAFDPALHGRPGPLVVEPTGDVLMGINARESNHALLRWVGADSATAVEDEDSPRPASSRLQGNYPNPFNVTTQITFQLARSEAASLQIFDLAGQLVATLWQGSTIGRYQVPWDGTANGNPVASGVYFYALFTPGQTHYGKMVLVR